jgi:hypothetical protein
MKVVENANFGHYGNFIAAGAVRADAAGIKISRYAKAAESGPHIRNLSSIGRYL